MKALPRLESSLAEGVGTVEIKSGYGLTFDDEAKMLRVASADWRATYSFTVKTTFLGAHAVPPEFEGTGGRLHRYDCQRLATASK